MSRSVVLPPRDGTGSMGSWREPDVNTTKLRRGDHDAADTKIGGGTHSHDIPLIIRRERNGNRKPMRAISAHHHSTFSYGDGYALPEAHVRRACELQMSALALTEHGNIDSHVKFEKAAKGSGVKPIFGSEIYMPAPASGKWWTNEKSQMKHHLTVLAMNAEGYRNLLALISKSWLNFHHYPTVTWAMLKEHKAGLLILSGCQGSILFCSTVGGKEIPDDKASYARGLKVARAFAAEFGDNYLIEVQAFPELEKTRQFNSVAGRLARAVRCRLAGTMDCHYTVLEEAEVQKILHNLRPGNKQTLEEQVRDWGYDVPLCPPLDDRSFVRRLALSGLSHREAIEAALTTEEIGAACNVTLPKLPMVRFPVPHGYEDARAYWRHLLKKGWKYRGFDKAPREYRERAKLMLRHEMELIESKDFVDYFLLVAAGVVYMKDSGHLCLARGSACASIAAYCLRITETNPLEFPYLRFDRFISVDREDLPDIDLDMYGPNRKIMRDFYEAMLGPGCVANVGTFTQYKGRNSLDDVARVFQVPKFKVETLKGYLIERSSGDLRASSTIEDTVAQFPAARAVWEEHPELGKGALLEGNIKNFGVHAGGLILSQKGYSITNVTALLVKEMPKGSGNFVDVIAMDKKDAERQGLLKLDYLGLDAIGMLEMCCEMLGVPLSFLYGLDITDPEVYKLLSEGDFVGVFQFDGKANRYVGNAVRPERFSEIMDCIALCRPGPLHNGGARDYADVKHNGTEMERHPALADITRLTKYQIIYQEQVLDICKIVGGFDQVGVSDARRIIAKKEGEQAFSRMKDLYLRGVATLHERTDYPPMSQEAGRASFGDLITSGSYAFNAAHSAGYGLVSFWTAWWKRYHLDIFYASCLSVTDDDNKKHQLLRDADRHGARALPPSPARSLKGWQCIRNGETTDLKRFKMKVPTIRAGFVEVDGIAAKTAASILDYRAEHGLKDWDDLINVKGIGIKTVDKIKNWITSDDPFGALALGRNIRAVKVELESGALGSVPKPTHTAIELPVEQGVQITVTWLGTFIDRNIRDIFEQNQAKSGEALDPSKVKDPHLNEWCQLTGEDETDQLLLKIDRWAWPKFKAEVFDFRMGKDLLLVQGVRPRYASSRQIKIKRLWVIDPEE